MAATQFCILWLQCKTLVSVLWTNTLCPYQRDVNTFIASSLPALAADWLTSIGYRNVCHISTNCHLPKCYNMIKYQSVNLGQIKGMTGISKLWKQFNMWKTLFEQGINLLPLVYFCRYWNLSTFSNACVWPSSMLGIAVLHVDKFLHRHQQTRGNQQSMTVGCNYLSLPEIPASGDKVLICNLQLFQLVYHQTAVTNSYHIYNLFLFLIWMKLIAKWYWNCINMYLEASILQMWILTN